MADNLDIAGVALQLGDRVSIAKRDRWGDDALLGRLGWIHSIGVRFGERMPRVSVVDTPYNAEGARWSDRDWEGEWSFACWCRADHVRKLELEVAR